MSYRTFFQTVVVASFVAVAATACNRNVSKVPEEQRATGEQPRNQPITVAGCLRTGNADNTFVLHAAKSEGAFQTSTYQLIGTEGKNARDYVGQQVEVDGTLVSEQQVASTGKVEEKPAKGTSGTPVVETKTELDVKKLDVAAVRPTGKPCTE